MTATPDRARILAEFAEFAEEVIAPTIYPEVVALEVTARHLAGEPVPAAQAVAGPFEPFSAFSVLSVGDRWGGMWGTTWFRCRAIVPDAWDGREVAAVIHLGGARTVGFSAEGLVWTPSLEPLQGLHHEHRELVVSTAAQAGEQVDFYIEAAANPIPRWHVQDWPRLEPDYAGSPLYALERADLAMVDREIEALWLDARLVLQIAEGLDQRADQALAALDDAFGAITAGGAASAPKARTALARFLASRGSVPGPGAGRHHVVAVGHAHIDTAWLWPVRETKRKCARSFANQLRLVDRFPEYRFACSQAVQYQWMKESYPDLYGRIRQAVAAGRWEPVGGMWVEADTNMPSGESLVRQFVHGKRFFLEELGVETHEMWLPDVFGYTAALPQIAAAAGVDALITQKMSWNDTNRFPHSTFWWEGHDGSRVLAHFPPADTYNGGVTVAELVRDGDGFVDRDRSGWTLYPFGYGDGGGGPTAHMIEAARRLADVDGLPAVELGTVAGFLDRVRAEQPDLETWVGELYLEAHRATTTTHADVKRGNRRSEEALRAAEMWSVAAGLPTAVDPLWRRLLLNQFHDILPGSSIAWVYRDSVADHDAILAETAALVAEAQNRLAAGSAVDGPAGDGSAGDGSVGDGSVGDGRADDGSADDGPGGPAMGLVAFNPSSCDRAEVVALPDGSHAWAEVPACGWAPMLPVSPPSPVVVGDGWMDNEVLRVTWDRHGLLTSVWDHAAGREVLAAGERGNLLQLHEDHPKAFDAWDVDRTYLDAFQDLTDLASVVVDQQGPMRGAVRFERRFGDSHLSQVMRLSAGSRRIEFHTEVDWRERHRFLKVAFPVAVRSSRATFEIQHGHIERPTVENTSWDRARFEVCGHRWADLSETGYGVALLNDCKYGYDIRGHTMRLSLLRGPGYPDPDADRGRHRFAYALLPHIGGPFGAGRVVEEAEALNLPLTLRPGRSEGGQVVAVDRPGVSVEAVKWADDGDGVVVRLCEVHGSRGPALVRVSWPFRSVERVDLLERPLAAGESRVGGEVEVDADRVRLELRPFELVSLRYRS